MGYNRQKQNEKNLFCHSLASRDGYWCNNLERLHATQ